MQTTELAGLRLVVFDWDGTLIDSEARIVASMEASIAAVGLEPLPRSALRNVIGLGLREALVMLYPDQDEQQLMQLIEAYRRQFVELNPIPQAPFPGAREVLEWLRERGLTLAVATGKARRGLDRSFDETGFGEFFAASRCADESGSKPHPRMLHELMVALDIAPEQTLMIGDTEYDLEMAQRAGVHALAVTCGMHAPERLQRWPTVAVLDDVAGLPGWWQARFDGND